ncbi:MAG: AAA family ATPase [Cytophagaceae bacterium]|nr:AAA family ATPase [Gemmatimonadaceae bacterium]
MPRPVREPFHLALVGLPGAGKTTVARSLARELAWPMLDFDEEIERREGRAIARIFEESGEDYFRARERDVTAELTDAGPTILSPGGGWITRSGTVDLIRNRTRLVWLRVSPGAAIRRMGGNRSARPLLMKGEPEAILARLEAERARFYAGSDAAINTEVLTQQQVVLQIGQLASFWGARVG